MKARLGPLLLDEARLCVIHGDDTLAFSRKAVELLVRLGRSGGQPVRRESLLCDLWPDREVSDKALSMLVVDVRRQLQPYFADQNPLQTVAGVGYVLSVPYERCESASFLSWGVGKARSRMTVCVATPTRLSGAEVGDLGACLRDTLLNILSKEPALDVSAREPRSIGSGESLVAGEEPTVIIQSSVRVIRREVLLSARCITAGDEKICWSACERAPLSRVFDAEIRLGERLRDELRLAATGHGGRQTWKEYRHSSGFDALADGQRLVAERSKPSFSAARAKFQHALALDPSCAPALVGMADCEILSTFYCGAEVAGAMHRASTYVEHALALDADLASAHCTRGFISLSQMRFAKAEQELLEAIRLDDSNAIAFQWYADFLASQGRIMDAVQMGHLALARAPHSVVVNVQLGQLLHMAGLFEQAQAQLERVLVLDPACSSTHAFLALNLAMAGSPAAFEHGRRAVALSPGAPFYQGVYGSVLAHLGERERALQQLHLLEAAAARAPAFAEAAMMVAITLGEPKRAIDWFRMATSHSAAWALYAAAFPILALIHKEPRFQALVRGRGMALVVS